MGWTDPRPGVRDSWDYSQVGTLRYGHDSDEIEIDDRTLVHLQIVLVGRLRRHESCSLSWSVAAGAGSGRETLWIHPSIPLRFRYASTDTGPINRVWIEQMTAAAGRGDLRITVEPTT